MIAGEFVKRPAAVLDYKFDWRARTNGNGKSDWLASGETIASYTIAPEAGITVDSDSLSNSNTSVTVWLSGGTLDGEYEVSCSIVTSAGRRDKRTM
jgi:aconitase A